MYILFPLPIFALLILTQDDTEFYLSVMKVGIMSIPVVEWASEGFLCVCV